MRDNLPTIWQQANLVLTLIRWAVVQRFARLHRYEIGVELIKNARLTVQAARRAALDGTSRKRLKIQALSDAIDELKDSMQQAEALQAFVSIKEFEAIAREIRTLGQQCGGWLRDPFGQGQNAPAGSPAGQRVQTLSARDASKGANS